MRGLLAAGFSVMVAGSLILSVGLAGEGGASAGGVVFIGSFPLVFGVGQDGGELALISVFIGGVMVVLALFWARGLRSRGAKDVAGR